MNGRIPAGAYPAIGLIAVFTGVGFWADGASFALLLAFPVVFGLAAWALSRRNGRHRAFSAGAWSAAAALAGTSVAQIGLWVPATLVVVALGLRVVIERRN